MLAVTDEEHINESLEDVVALLEAEIARLRESLEVHRLSRSPNRRRNIQRHIQLLDDREGALADLKAMLAARDTPTPQRH